ncbi:MAG: oxidoreductase [Deltaproteobacteria bacterium CG_4_10_14_3_um_filter_60_8]|nr:MAG: oxidoreductase [Desulfobacterales bacterium CG2_30_60_27]PIP44661.1 MAG: oxidoreductase [Deltaproteobacteria bacterium CG23_combo_of_CG06-09_8_20_14_all_60_8]PIY20504.1 MAG: oxidoreductase [Deltaproteobacteria bacterium CG_4_10_14_3_um_filter_60_8]
MEPLVVHGLSWTTKELFTYPNEFIYWSIQIVMYPYMTGLVAGAFVLSSLYHVFGQHDLKDMARFALVFSLALLPVAMMPLLFHLQQPLRGVNVMFTPHFTSAIAAFGIVFSTYAIIVLSEIWFVYREYFIEQTVALQGNKSLSATLRRWTYHVLVLGAYDRSPEAMAKDKKAIKLLAAIGIPVACFLHGYAGFIFGSVKANALWMSPLMPVIFIMSAIVSGIALCMLTYIVIMEFKSLSTALAKGRGDESVQVIKGVAMDVISKTSRYLLGFLLAAIILELLDLIFRGYTAMKSWDILRSVMYGKDFVNIFVLQYGLGDLVPLVLLLMPRPTIRRTIITLLLVLFGVFMMRWNVVIGGQAFSLSFAGYMHYNLPIIPHSVETFKEGLLGALTVGSTPFVLFWFINKFVPSLRYR